MKKFEQYLIDAAEALHLRVFGHAMSIDMKRFLSNLSLSFIGGFVAASILFAINILAGRWLGPQEYGKYTLVSLMTQFYFIPMLMGMDVSISRTIALRASSLRETARLLSSAVVFVLCSSLLFSTILFLLKGNIARFFSTSEQVVMVALFFCLVLIVKMLFDGAIRGLHLFRLQATAKIIEAIVALGVFLFLYKFLGNSYLAISLAISSAGLVVIVMYFANLRQYIGPVSFKIFRELFSYSRFVVVGLVISLILIFGERFMVNHFFGTKELGIYGAYYLATILVVGQFATIMDNVFFPTLAKISSKQAVLSKLDKLLFVGAIPITAGIFVIGYAVFTLFGHEYPLNIVILLLFSSVAMLQLFSSMYANITNVHAEQTYAKGLIFYGLRVGLYLVYILILIKLKAITIPAILAGLLVQYALGILNFRYIIRNYAAA